MTDSYAFTAFGVPVATSGTTVNPHRYIGALGYYTDPTGLSYVRARYLRPTTGSWLSVDPVQSEPRYQYVGGRATRSTDASGTTNNPPPSIQPLPAHQATPVRAPRAADPQWCRRHYGVWIASAGESHSECLWGVHAIYRRCKVACTQGFIPGDGTWIVDPEADDLKDPLYGGLGRLSTDLTAAGVVSDVATLIPEHVRPRGLQAKYPRTAILKPVQVVGEAPKMKPGLFTTGGRFVVSVRTGLKAMGGAVVGTVAPWALCLDGCRLAEEIGLHSCVTIYEGEVRVAGAWYSECMRGCP